MMFYTDSLPSVYPVMLHPRRSQSCYPCGGSLDPLRMHTANPEMAPRCHKRRVPHESILAQLLANYKDDSDSSSDSDEEFNDFLTWFGYPKRQKRKGSDKPGKERSKKTDAKSGETVPQPRRDSKCSKSYDEAPASDSDDQEFLDFLTWFGFPKQLARKKSEKTKEPSKKMAKEEEPKTEHSTEKSETAETKPNAKIAEESMKTDEQNNSTADPKDNTNDVIGSPLDMRGCHPRNISIKTNEEQRIVTITAKRVIRTLFGPLVSQRNYVFPIPEGTAASDIRSFLSPEGVLYLKISKQLEAITSTNQDAESSRDDETENKMDNSSKQVDMASTEKVDTAQDHVDSEISESKISPQEDKPIELNSSDEQPAESPEPKKDDTMETETVKTDSNETERKLSEAMVENKQIEEPAQSSTDETTAEKENESYDVIISQFEMSGFEADDIKVDISEDTRSIEITAKREENTPNRLLLREYYRTIPVPEEVSPAEIRSHLSPEGVFFLQAPSNPALTQ